MSLSLIYWQYNVTIVSVRSIDYSYKSRTYMHRRFFLFFNVSFHFLKLINTLVVQVDLQRFRPEFHAFHSIMQQMLATKTTVYDPSWHTHTKLCHFNNGVCCGYDSKTKSRPASIIISFKLFPHKNNTLVKLHVLAMSSRRKWLSFMSSCDVT